MKNNNKVGLAILTHKRFDYVKQCLKALQDNNYGGADIVYVIEDGHDYTDEQVTELIAMLPNITNFIEKDNGGVATAKNLALKTLIKEGCEHLFLMEDDIIMKHPETCQHYISYANKHDIKHLNFAHHGPANINKPAIINGICAWRNCVGAFSYYTKDLIEEVGYMDENFKNAWEHVYHTYKIAKAGYTTPFWHFADHPSSKQMLEEIPGSIENSSIRPKEDWAKNIEEGKKRWIELEGEWLPPRN